MPACGVFLLYLPAVPRFFGMLGYSGWQQRELTAAELPWHFFAAYTAGDTMPAPWHAWLPWLYAVLLLAGIVAWWRRSREAALLLICAAGVPIAAAWVLAFSQPQFHERYTMLATAPLLLLAGGGFALFDAGFWSRRTSPALPPRAEGRGVLLRRFRVRSAVSCLWRCWRPMGCRWSGFTTT